MHITNARLWVVRGRRQEVHGLKRVLIIDFDVHHGNGTSDAFWADPDVLFLSTHQARAAAFP